MARTYTANDYAGVQSKNLSAYYGYEETVGDGDDEEWCFVAKVGEKEILRIPQSKLKTADGFDCGASLLEGIGALFDKFKLNLET